MWVYEYGLCALCLWLCGESMCGLSKSKCGVSALRVYGVNTM